MDESRIKTNKQLCRRYYTAYGKEGPSILDEVLSPKFVDHNAFPGFESDLEGAQELARQVRTAFPDGRMRIDHLVAEGDYVAIHWTFVGRFSAPFMGVAANNKDTSMTGIELVRIRNGLIVEAWHSEDLLGWMQSVGALPEIGHAVVA